MQKKAPRPVIVVAVTTVLSVGIAAFYLKRHFAEREPGLFVEVIDTTADLFTILEKRFQATGELDVPSDGYPPPLVREPIDEALTAKFYPQLTKKEFLYDPHLFFRRKGPRQYFRKFAEYPGGGWELSTNSLGMREPEEVRAEKPDVRILVTGDSHTSGVVHNSASFTNVMEALLAERRAGETVEALNAGAGGYNFYNYIGALERYKEELDPDVFVFVVFGGNDFSGAMFLQRFFHRRKPPRLGPHKQNVIHNKFGRRGEIVSQEIGQMTYFLNNPGDEQVVIDLACSVTAEVQRQCDEAGIRFVVGYIPPPLTAQPELHADEITEYLEAYGVGPEALDVTDRIADGWIAFLEERGIPCADMRAVFREQTEPLYWEANNHINIEANRLVAEALLPLVESVLE